MFNIAAFAPASNPPIGYFSLSQGIDVSILGTVAQSFSGAISITQNATINAIGTIQEPSGTGWISQSANVEIIGVAYPLGELSITQSFDIDGIGTASGGHVLAIHERHTFKMPKLERKISVLNYTKNMVVRVDRDWQTDFTFDFSNEIEQIINFNVNATDSILILDSGVLQQNKIVVRVGSMGIIDGQKQPLTVSATSLNGEIRDFTVLFLFN